MFIVDINYTVPFEEIEKHMEGHVEYLRKYMAKNVFLVTGKKSPRTGGILIALADSKEQVEKIITEDPFHRHNLAEMTVTEFSHVRHIPLLDGLLGKSV